MKITTEEVKKQIREAECGPDLIQPNSKIAAIMAPFIREWKMRVDCEAGPIEGAKVLGYCTTNVWGDDDL